MVESSAFPKPREANDAGYQRISSFAVAGLAVGVVFVVFLLLQVVIGLLSHSTVLLPLWLEFIAALGAALSLIGSRSIRRSDGTLAGLRIAKCGFWLSLVAGLGYGSYYGATYLAIRQQADAFAEDWFEKIRKGKVNEAFLMTLSPGVARDANPDDERTMIMRLSICAGGRAQREAAPKAGQLDQFRHNEIIQSLKQGGEKTKITPLGVSSWEHKEGTYLVRRVYGIETPEAMFDLRITAVGKDAPEATEKGRWFVLFPETTVEKDSLRKSRLGVRLDQMRQSGYKFFAEEDGWANKILSGKLQAAFLDTPDPKNLLDFSHLTGEDKAARDAVELGLRNMMSHQSSGFVPGVFLARPTSMKRFWSVDGERRVLLPVDCQITIGPPGGAPVYYADAVAWLQGDPGQLEDDTGPRWRLHENRGAQSSRYLRAPDPR